ncbi:hypothetical protein TMatcc_009775 [Talaromyces marneffei ATCC 18224]
MNRGENIHDNEESLSTAHFTTTTRSKAKKLDCTYLRRPQSNRAPEWLRPGHKMGSYWRLLGTLTGDFGVTN